MQISWKQKRPGEADVCIEIKDLAEDGSPPDNYVACATWIKHVEKPL